MRHLVLLAIFFAVGCGQRPAQLGDSGAVDSYPPASGDRPPLGSCDRLAGLGGGLRLTGEHARSALFARSLERVLIVTHRDGGHGELLSVALPSGKAVSLASGVAGAEWLGGERAVLAVRPPSVKSATPYELVRVSLAGQSTSLGSSVCSHRATPDGSRVYVVRGDCNTFTASLELVVIDLQRGVTTPLARGASDGIAVSADSRWAAAVVDVAPKSGCYETGTLDSVDASGKLVTIARNVLPRSAEFLPSGQLLYEVIDGCSASAGTFIADPASGQTRSLGLYQVSTWLRPSTSSDGLLLGSTAPPAGERYTLFAIPTDGGAPRPLASDLYPYLQVQAVYQAWALSASGKHVVYVSRLPGTKPGLALSTVPLGGGAPAVISSQTSFLSDPTSLYAVAPLRDEVAHLTRGPTEQSTVVSLSDLPPTRSVPLAESSFPIDGLSYRPDGNGVLFIETSPGAGSKLLHASREGLSQLGRWTTSRLDLPGWRTMRRHYVIDPAGCSVLHDTDVGPDPGTRLALLPR